MKKSLTLFLISLLSLVIGLAVFTGCEGKRPKVEAPVIAENVQTVELGTDDDLAFSVDWKNGTLTEVKKGQTSLTSTNYEVSENSLTIKGDYVATLLEGENIFTLITDGGTADFKIIVTDSRPANPTVTPDKTSAFNTLAPDDLITYTIAWGKGTFSSLKVGEETLEKDTDYTVEGDTLSIVGKGLIDSWDAGTYTFTLTTSTGSATFDLTVVMSGSRYLDQKVFKESNGNDVSFAMLIGTNTSITSVKLGETALTASDYEYSLANEAFILKSTYLETLPAGIYEFVITLDDETSYVVSVAVGTVFADNFENGNTNGANITFGNGNSSVSGEDAIEGKSVNMDLESPNIAGTLLHVKGITLVPNTLYVLNMTVRIDGETQLIFTLPAQAGNQAWMNADGTLSTTEGQFIDSRSTSTKISDNVYQFKIYLPVTAFDENGVNVNIYFRNGDLSEGAPSVQEHTKLVIDNIYLVENTTETFLPASKATIAPEYQEIPSIQDVNVTVNNNYGTFVSITENDSALLDSDYIIDGNTLTIKADYFTARGMAVGQSFTFTYNTVNPDNNDQAFATTFTVKYNATVWGSVYEKEFDGESDVSFDVSIGEVSGVVVKLGANELTASDFAVSSTAITVKANYLKTLETNKVYQFVMVDSSDNQFRFAIYVGCTAQNVLYYNFENGVLPSSESLGIVMSRTLNESGFDGKSVTLSGTGTALYVNRPVAGADMNTTIVLGETYELSMQFKFTDGGKPVAGAGNGYGAFTGNANIVFAILDGAFEGGNYASIDVDVNGDLSLVNVGAIADKSSFLKDTNGVYTLVLTFVATGNADLQVPCWNNCTFDIDNIMLRKVPGVPTISGEYTFDKSTNEDVNIPVNMHGSTLTEVKIGDIALTSSDYEISGETLVIKATKLATYETDTTVSVTIVSNAGTSNAITIKIADAAPFLTDGNVYEYGPDEPLMTLGLDANGKTIKEVKAGDNVVPETAYTYDDSTKTFTFTESYLMAIEGTVEHTITFENTTVELQFNVVSKILDMVLSMDFEDDNAVAPVGQLGTSLDGLASLTQEIISDNGSKALKIANVPEGLITIYSTISSVNLDPTYSYMYQLDITVKVGVPVLFRYVEAAETTRDFFWIQTDGTLVNWVNPHYDLVKTDLGNGYVRYEIMAFATPTLANVSGNGNFEIATFADGTGAFDVTLDNFRIAKTSYPIFNIDFEDDDYKHALGNGLAMSATTEVYTGENSISGNNSLHYTASVATNLLLIRPNNFYIGANLVAGATYKLSFKLQISNFPTNMEQLQMPIFGTGGDIGYVRPDPNAPGEPFMEVPTGSGYVGEKTVIDADKDIYELSITWTNPAGKVELDFSIWGVVDMVIDDICLEVVR